MSAIFQPLNRLKFKGLVILSASEAWGNRNTLVVGVEPQGSFGHIQETKYTSSFLKQFHLVCRGMEQSFLLAELLVIAEKERTTCVAINMG